MDTLVHQSNPRTFRSHNSASKRSYATELCNNGLMNETAMTQGRLIPCGFEFRTSNTFLNVRQSRTTITQLTKFSNRSHDAIFVVDMEGAQQETSSSTQPSTAATKSTIPVGNYAETCARSRGAGAQMPSTKSSMSALWIKTTSTLFAKEIGPLQLLKVQPQIPARKQNKKSKSLQSSIPWTSRTKESLKRTKKPQSNRIECLTCNIDNVAGTSFVHVVRSNQNLPQEQ